MSNYAVLVEEMQSYRLSMIKMGALLRLAKETELWKDEIGDGVNTWYDFIAQPEIGLAQSEAKFLIDLADLADLVGIGEMTRVPTQTAKAMLRNGGDIMDAQTLTTKDFKERNFDRKTKERGNRTYSYLVMKLCNETGTMSKVHNVNDEELLSVIKETDG